MGMPCFCAAELRQLRPLALQSSRDCDRLVGLPMLVQDCVHYATIYETPDK